jgi:hypothetical protein
LLHSEAGPMVDDSVLETAKRYWRQARRRRLRSAWNEYGHWNLKTRRLCM